MIQPHYSVAICPPKDFTDLVKAMKLELAERIGWFNSKNSEAHVTLNTFIADEAELLIWKNYLTDFCSSADPFEIRLVETGSYANGAFYLAPDHESTENLVQLMKHFHHDAPLKPKTESRDPHLSIARQLSREQLAEANELFGDKQFDLKFMCDNLAIRQFETKKKQYFVESRFMFGK